MNEFKAGDRVIVSDNTVSELEGQYGIVLSINDVVGLVEVQIFATGKIFYFQPHLLRKIGPTVHYYKAYDKKRDGKHQDYVTNNLDIRNSIKNVIFNNPATIVLWADGTKTVVKAEHEDFDPEKGLAMAVSKKVLGNKGNYYKVFKKWLPKEEETESLYEELLNFIHHVDIANKTEKRSCSSCARFDDEHMVCMISQPCIGYDKYVKKDTHE